MSDPPLRVVTSNKNLSNLVIYFNSSFQPLLSTLQTAGYYSAVYRMEWRCGNHATTTTVVLHSCLDVGDLLMED